MPLPTLERTWQFNVNQLAPADINSLTTVRVLMKALVDSFIGFESSPWTVRYSCNSITAGSVGDGVNRWASVTDLVWNTGAHSWIVLRSQGLGTLEFCIDLSNTTPTNGTIVVSPSAGFTGGTTTARPTATDQQIIVSNTTWTPSTALFGTALHVWHSTDGESTRVVMHQNGVPGAVAFFGKVAAPPSGWTTPYVFQWYGTASAIPAAKLTYALMNDTAAFSALHGATVFTLFGATAGFIAGTVGEQVNAVYNEIDGSLPMTPVSLASTTIGVRGFHGYLRDWWYGANNIVVEGTTFPNDTSRQFVQFSHMIYPWNGTIPALTGNG